MSTILLDSTHNEMLTVALSALYSSGPAILKLCSGAYDVNYDLVTDKVLAIGASRSYVLGQDNVVTFLEIDDFIGLEEGMGQLIELWDATDTDCYFRFRTSVERPIVGNNDIIRMQQVTLEYNQSTVVQVEEDSPAYFPVQYKLTFPNYVVRTDYHKIESLNIAFRRPDNSGETTIRVFDNFTGGDTINSTNMGWRGIVDNTINDDYYYKFEWSDELNCILTIDTLKTNYPDSQIKVEIYSKFYTAFDDYPAAPLQGSLPADVYSGSLTVERKRNTDTVFTPMTVVQEQGVDYSYAGIALQNPTVRFFSISSTWTWDMLA